MTGGYMNPRGHKNTCGRQREPRELGRERNMRPSEMEATAVSNTLGVNITGRSFVADLMVGRPASNI